MFFWLYIELSMHNILSKVSWYQDEWTPAHSWELDHPLPASQDGQRQGTWKKLGRRWRGNAQTLDQWSGVFVNFSSTLRLMKGCCQSESIVMPYKVYVLTWYSASSLRCMQVNLFIFTLVPCIWGGLAFWKLSLYGPCLLPKWRMKQN